MNITEFRYICVITYNQLHLSSCFLLASSFQLLSSASFAQYPPTRAHSLSLSWPSSLQFSSSTQTTGFGDRFDDAPAKYSKLLTDIPTITTFYPVFIAEMPKKMIQSANKNLFPDQMDCIVFEFRRYWRTVEKNMVNCIISFDHSAMLEQGIFHRLSTNYRFTRQK